MSASATNVHCWRLAFERASSVRGRSDEGVEGCIGTPLWRCGERRGIARVLRA